MAEPVRKHRSSELFFWREAHAYDDGSVPGWLFVARTLFPTIERGLGWKHLPVGTFEMRHTTKTSGRPVHCLAPVDSSYGTLLIHDAKDDSSLTTTGCIAPGMRKKQARESGGIGIVRSAEAMEGLWELLGGWRNDKRATLYVINNFPGQ